MAHTTKVPLGAPTYVRKWYLDVNVGNYEAPSWTGVFGVTEFKQGIDPTMVDDSDFDSGGWKSSSSSALAWALDFKVSRKTTASSATAYDPGQEALRAASTLFGASNRVDIRWYEVTSGGPTVEAYRGYASVSWVPDGGGMDAEEFVSVTLTGQGTRSSITHPDGASAAVPALLSLAPYTDVEAGGALVTITGTGFTGTITDGVLFGVETCDFTVLNDNVIVAVAPAQSDGAVDVSVENATGISTVTKEFVYTVAP